MDVACSEFVFCVPDIVKNSGLVRWYTATWRTALLEKLKVIQLSQKFSTTGGRKKKARYEPLKPIISEEHFLLLYRHSSTYTIGTYWKMWPPSRILCKSELSKHTAIYVYTRESSWNPNWNLISRSMTASPSVLMPSGILPLPSPQWAFILAWKNLAHV